MFDRYVSAILRFRWLVVIGVFLFIGLTMTGLSKILLVSDYESFIDPEFPGFIELEKMEEAFTKNQNLMVAIVPANGDVFTESSISLIQQVTERFWQVPFVLRVDSLTNFQHTQAEGDDLIVGDLFPLDRVTDQSLLDRGKSFAPTEPRLIKNLISEDYRVAVVSALFEIPDDVLAHRANEQILAEVELLLDEAAQDHPSAKFYVAGVVPIDHSLGKYGERDNATLIPGMLLLMAVILYFMTRSFSGVFAASLVVVFTGIGSLGLLGLKGWIIDPGSAIAPIVIMTLAVADSVHVVEGMQNAMRFGANKIDAIVQSLRDNFLPVFLTSLTTVMGVVTFTFADMPSQQRLGVTVALGVTIAFILSVTLLPAMLAILPMKVVPRKKPVLHFDKVADFSIKHFRLIVVVSTLLTVVLASLIPLNRFNDSPSAMLAKRTPERQATEFFEENVSGIIKIDLAVFAEEAGGVSDPAFLANVDRFVSWARAQDNIDNVATLTDTFKRLNQNMHGGDPSWYRIPDSKELAAQYLLLYELSLPYGLSLDSELTLDKSGIRMTMILGGSDSEQIVKTKQTIQKWFADNAPEMRAVVTGPTQLMAELSYIHMIPSMLKGGIIAILMVSLVLFFSLRSWRLGFLGVLANMVPVVMGYGIWYLIDGQVNFIVASVAGVCLGVVVDFAVHFLSKYRRERKAGFDVDTAIRHTFAKVGRPLWTTMIVLVSGFWLLMLSPVTLSFSMGYLTGIIIVLALAFDFLALPALIKLFDSDKSDGAIPIVAKQAI